jgi:hypothetical protein
MKFAWEGGCSAPLPGRWAQRHAGRYTAEATRKTGAAMQACSRDMPKRILFRSLIRIVYHFKCYGFEIILLLSI